MAAFKKPRLVQKYIIDPKRISILMSDGRKILEGSAQEVNTVNRTGERQPLKNLIAAFFLHSFQSTKKVKKFECSTPQIKKTTDVHTLALSDTGCSLKIVFFP